jgi:hypothetical protein
MRGILFTLISLACSVVLASTTIYKWVDENGVVHYSDQPHQNAEKLQVEGAQTYPSSGARTPYGQQRHGEDSSRQRAEEPYEGCSIVQPGAEQTLENVDSTVVNVQTIPALRQGDRIYLSMDGQPLNGGQPTGNPFGISQLVRGSHTLSAQVRGTDGTVLCQSQINFYVHQPSVANPASPIRPH